jgi:hypothetical protein
MKKILVISGILFLMAKVSYAGTIGPIAEDIYATNDTTRPYCVANLSISVTTGDIVATRSFDLEAGKYFAVSYQVTDVSGSPSLKIQLEQSFAKPTTEGIESLSDTNWVVPENMSNIESTLTDNLMHHKALSPVALPFGRFKITENSGGSCTVRMRISTQRDR